MVAPGGAWSLIYGWSFPVKIVVTDFLLAAVLMEAMSSSISII
jgi:hypothetical protein